MARAIRSLGLLTFALGVLLASTAHAVPKLVEGALQGGWMQILLTTWPPDATEMCPCDRIPVPSGMNFTGVPIAGTGTASVMGTNPASFTIPSGIFTVVTSGTRDPATVPTPFVSSRTRFDGSNAAGSFLAGRGPGTPAGALVTFAPNAPPGPGGGRPVFPASVLRVGYQGGPNTFGGTMKILGNFDSSFAWVSTPFGPGLFRGTVPVVLDATGGVTSSSNRFTGTIAHTTVTTGGMPLTTMTEYTVWGFPWTTGTVSAIALTGTQPTSSTASGSDARTPMGEGTIQVVTPWLVAFRGERFGTTGALSGTYTGTLRFMPEPGAVPMLGAGLALLGALYRLRRR